MISSFVSVVINTMHDLFKEDCKQTVNYNDYNICILNYYITSVIVFFICPYIVTKVFYNTLKDRLYTALFYLFLFITLVLFL
jgi:hypothetical protein